MVSAYGYTLFQFKILCLFHNYRLFCTLTWICVGKPISQGFCVWLMLRWLRPSLPRSSLPKVNNLSLQVYQMVFFFSLSLSIRGKNFMNITAREKWSATATQLKRIILEVFFIYKCDQCICICMTLTLLIFVFEVFFEVALFDLFRFASLLYFFVLNALAAPVCFAPCEQLKFSF